MIGRDPLLALRERHRDAWRAINAATDAARPQAAARQLAEAHALLAALQTELGLPAPQPSPAVATVCRVGRDETAARELPEAALDAAVNAAIPALWNDARAVADALFARAPWRAFAYELRGLPTLLVAAVVCAAAVALVRQALPSGATVRYFRGDSPRASAVRREPRVDRDYGTGRPAHGLPRDGWRARWEADLHVPTNGVYDFFAQGRNGFSVAIDGGIALANPQPGSFQGSGVHTSLWLTAGTHRLSIDHSNTSGPAAIRLRWAGPGVGTNVTVAAPFITRHRRAAP